MFWQYESSPYLYYEKKYIYISIRKAGLKIEFPDAVATKDILLDHT